MEKMQQLCMCKKNAQVNEKCYLVLPNLVVSRAHTRHVTIHADSARHSRIRRQPNLFILKHRNGRYARVRRRGYPHAVLAQPNVDSDPLSCSGVARFIRDGVAFGTCIGKLQRHKLIVRRRVNPHTIMLQACFQQHAAAINRRNLHPFHCTLDFVA